MTEQCSAYTCPVEAIISLIGGKYKAVILWHPMNGTLRYSELHRKMPKATDKMLAQQLRELEKDGLINRVVYPVVLPLMPHVVSLSDTSALVSLCMDKSFVANYSLQKGTEILETLLHFPEI